MKKVIILLVIILSCSPGNLSAERQEPYIRENFDTLMDWLPLTFPKIKKHTKYSIVSENRNNYLMAESNSSASGIIYKKQFSIYTYPVLKWHWKVMNVYQKGNASTKAGDDYPLRIYVVFQYDPKKASLFERVRYKAAKLLYGEYPPHSTLNYIWANREHLEMILTSPYTDKSKMVVVEKGMPNTDTWMEVQVNVVKDYQKAFGELPPEMASIAVMSDSDNTGEKAVAYIDYIEILENSR